MPATSHLTIAVVAEDAAAAETACERVRRALATESNGWHRNVELTQLAGGADAAVEWLAKRQAAGSPLPALVMGPAVGPTRVLELFDAGANGVLAERNADWLVRHAVGVVQAGGWFLDPWLAHDVADLARPRSPNLLGVTAAEQRVLGHAARGLEIPAIAELLGISRDTVKGHLHSIGRRLGVSRREMIKTARSAGLIPAVEQRSRVAMWDSARGLHGLSVFAVGRARLARETLARALAGVGARVVGQGSDAEALLRVTQSWSATVVLSEEPHTDLTSLRSARPTAGVVVVPWAADSRALRAVLGARAHAMVGMDAGLDQLIAGIRVAAAGGLYLDTAALRLLLAAADRAATAHVGPLTRRQMEILRLLERRLSNAAIAHELGLAEPTVKGHVRRILCLLGVSNRRDAPVAAYRAGLLEPGSSYSVQ